MAGSLTPFTYRVYGSQAKVTTSGAETVISWKPLTNVRPFCTIRLTYRAPVAQRKTGLAVGAYEGSRVGDWGDRSSAHPCAPPLGVLVGKTSSGNPRDLDASAKQLLESMSTPALKSTGLVCW